MTVPATTGMPPITQVAPFTRLVAAWPPSSFRSSTTPHGGVYSPATLAYTHLRTGP